MGAGDVVVLTRPPVAEAVLAKAFGVWRARERASVAGGACPDCGSDEWEPRSKGQLLIRCARCGASFTLEAGA